MTPQHQPLPERRAQAAVSAVMLPDLILVELLADFLGCSRSTARSYLRQGLLPGRKVGRRWVVERRALLRAVAPSSASPHQDDPRPPLRVLDGARP